MLNLPAQCVHGAHRCIIPSPANDDRPYLLRHRSLTWLTLFLFLSKALAIGILAIVPASAELSTITTSRIIQLTNEERKKVGARPLEISDRLMQAAAEKGNHMLAEDYFAHISPTGVTPWFWIQKANYDYSVAGENLAIDFVAAEDVVQAWLDSPSHKANMLHTDYTQTGVAVVSGEFQGGTSIIVVHMFGTPQVAAATTQAPAVVPSPVPSLAPTPEPSPAASASPSPSVAPIPLRSPRIALQQPTDLVGSQIHLTVEGELGTTVSLLLNGTVQETVALTDEPSVKIVLGIAEIPDGDVTIRAYSSRPGFVTSPLSDSLALVKDTTGPQLAEDSLHFLAHPLTDRNVFLLLPLDSSLASVALVAQSEPTPAGALLFSPSPEPFTFMVKDTAGNATSLTLSSPLLPQFVNPDGQAQFSGPRSLLGMSRRMALSAAVALFLLLVITVLVRIEVQRPRLIFHTVLVLLIASFFFIF